MLPLYAGQSRISWRVLAWTALMTTTLLLVVLLQALAARALDTPAPAAPSAACQSANPTTAALADGDDVRARFLASLCSGSIGTTSQP